MNDVDDYAYQRRLMEDSQGMYQYHDPDWDAMADRERDEEHCACGHARKLHYAGTIFHHDISGCNGEGLFISIRGHRQCGCIGFRG